MQNNKDLKLNHITQIHENTNLSHEESEKKSTLLLYGIFPELLNVDTYILTYYTDNGFEASDYPLSFNAFPTDVTNWLQVNEIHTINELINFDLDNSQDSKCVYHYINRFLKKHLKYEIPFNTPDHEKYETASKAIMSFFQYDIELYGNGLDDALKFSIINNLDLIDTQLINFIEQSLNDDTILIKLLKDEHIISWMKKYINTLFANLHVISGPKLQQECPQWANKYGIFNEALFELIDSMQIEIVDGLYRKKLPYLNEWLTNLTAREEAIMKMRLSGKTLQECANSFMVTKERIRQIERKSLRRKHYTSREDEYEYWFKKYRFPDDSWETIFDLDKSSYYYFKIQYDEGTNDLEDILQDHKMDAYLYPRVKKYLSKTYASIEDEYIQLNKNKIALKLAEKFHNEKDITIPDFLNEYNLFLMNNHLENNKKLIFSSERAFEGLMQRSSCILMKYGRRLRYYPINKYDIKELVDMIHLDYYQNIEISTKKIFDDYPNVMESFNIHDEYELHNLLKKTLDIWNPNQKQDITITRMPLITFGTADRVKQAENLLFQIAPVTSDEFGQYYEMEYGVLAKTAIANVGKYLDKYFHNGIYSINQPLFSEQEKEYMLNHLPNDFYFWNDIQNIYIEHFGESELNHLNARNIKSLGFKVYNGYIINDGYPSADNYFYNLILENESFDLSTLDSRIIYIRIFDKVLNELRCSFKILEYADKKYVRFDRFNKIVDSETPQTLLNYVDKAIHYSDQEQFFTFKTLKIDGFKDDYENLGFGDWFSSALIKNSKRIKYLRVGGNILFYKGSANKTTIDFLEYILESFISLDIYDLLDHLKNRYDITLPKSKVLAWLKESDMYYSDTMEKIYLTEDEFYNDL